MREMDVFEDQSLRAVKPKRIGTNRRERAVAGSVCLCLPAVGTRSCKDHGTESSGTPGLQCRPAVAALTSVPHPHPGRKSLFLSSPRATTTSMRKSCRDRRSIRTCSLRCRIKGGREGSCTSTGSERNVYT